MARGVEICEYNMFKYLKKDVLKRLNPMESKIYSLKCKFKDKQRNTEVKFSAAIIEDIERLKYASSLDEFCLYPELISKLTQKIYQLQKQQLDSVIDEYSKQTFTKIITKLILFSQYLEEKAIKEQLESISLLCDEIKEIVKDYKKIKVTSEIDKAF